MRIYPCWRRFEVLPPFPRSHMTRSARRALIRRGFQDPLSFPLQTTRSRSIRRSLSLFRESSSFARRRAEIGREVSDIGVAFPAILGILTMIPLFVYVFSFTTSLCYSLIAPRSTFLVPLSPFPERRDLRRSPPTQSSCATKSSRGPDFFACLYIPPRPCTN